MSSSSIFCLSRVRKGRDRGETGKDMVSRPRRASVREAAKRRWVRKIDHTPAPLTSTTHKTIIFPAALVLYSTGQNGIIGVAKCGLSRCVWSHDLRRQGAGCWRAPLLLAPHLCLGSYYTECFPKKQPSFPGRGKEIYDFLP